LIKANHLPKLIGKALQNLPNHSKSILCSISGLYNFSDPLQFTAFTAKSKDLSNILTTIREKIKRTEKINIRLTIFNQDDFLENRKILLEEIDLTTSNYEAENPDWKAKHLVLTEADKSRQLQKLTNELAALRISLEDDENFKNKTISDLREAGCLTSALVHGNLDSGLDWLHFRTMNSRTRVFNSFHQFSSSRASFQNRIMTNYRFLYTISGHSYNPVYCSVFDQTGKFLLTGADDYLVKIWDINRGQLIRTCRGHKNYITFIAVSSDNSLFASACTGGIIRVWRLRDGYCLLVLHHNASVNWLKFDPATGTLASVGDDGYAMIWDLSKLVDVEIAGSPLLKETALKTALKTVNLGNLASPVNLATNSWELLQEEHDMQVEGNSNTNNNNNNNNNQSLNQSSSDNPPRPVLLSSPAFQQIQNSFSRDSQQQSGNDDLSKSIIGFPHLQNDFPGNPSGEAESMKKILSLDISPVGNILVTGSDDSVVRIWKLNSSQKNLGRYEDLKTRYPRMKRELDKNDFLKFERIADHLLLKLEGHVNPVTDIQINSIGDRVLTASTSDGNVRIWSLSSDFTESVHIVLNLDDENEENENTASNFRPVQMRVRGRNNAGNKSKVGIHVYNVCWTCDDQKVVTVHSVASNHHSSNNSDGEVTRLKVWNSVTGDILHVIKNISDTASRCLCRHPLNPSFLATAGEDGIFNVWNIEEEKNVMNYKLVMENPDAPGTFDPANIVDLSYSPDGSHIAATDSFGRLSLFGLEDPQLFANVICEQYFSSDYSEIMHDNEGNALDIGTQLPVHLSPVGVLCRINGSIHELQPKIQTYPIPVAEQIVKQKLAQLKDDRRALVREQEKMFRIIQRNKQSGRPTKTFLGLRKNKESPKLLKKSSKPFSYRPKRFNYIDFDVEGYQPSPEELSYDSDYREGSSKNDDEDLVEDGRGDDEEYAGYFDEDSSLVLPTRRSKRRKALKKKRERAVRSGTMRRSRRARTHVESYDDAYDDNESVSIAKPQTVRAARLKARKQRKAYNGGDSSQDEEDDDATVSDMEEEDNEEVLALSDNSGEDDRPKKKRGRPKRDADDSSPSPVKQRKRLPQTSTSSSAAVQPKRTKKTKIDIFESALQIDRSWLQMDTPQETLYVPQIGDHVIYFPQGHKEHLQRFTEDVPPPWNSFPQKWPLVECVVREVSYRFPKDQELRWCNSIVAEVTLAIIGTPSKNAITVSGMYLVSFVPPRATRNSTREQLIKVTLRNTQLPDFLVLFDIFQRTIKMAWHQGIQISVQYKEFHPESGDVIFQEYQGKVVSLSNSDPEWPHSPWEALEVTWDDNKNESLTIDRICPWEAKAVFSSHNFTAIGSKIDPAESIRIVSAVQSLLEQTQEKYEPFQFEVDSSVYPEYYCLIALPVYVELIVRRLQNGYYRQVISLFSSLLFLSLIFFI
jgi:WD40 repeat protein